MENQEKNQTNPINNQAAMVDQPDITKQTLTSPKNTNKWIIPLLVFLIVLLIGSTSFFAYRYFQPTTNRPTDNQQQIINEAPKPTSFPTTEQKNTQTPEQQTNAEPVEDKVMSKLTTDDWKQFTDSGSLVQMKYPPNWKFKELNLGFTVGPKEIAEDYLWGVNYYSTQDQSLTNLMDDIGDQFEDRKQTSESFSLNGYPATRVTTTTPSIPDWHSEIIIVEYGQSLITVSNGAISDEKLPTMPGTPKGITFADFYNTFKPMN